MSGWDQGWDVDNLTRTLTELRDGTAPPPAEQGAARARRIEKMQHDIALCKAFVADCNRYRDDPASCLTPLVPNLMGKHLANLRAHAIRTEQRLRDEIRALS